MLTRRELSNIYIHRSPNIVRVNKTRILRWAGHVVRIEEGRCTFKISTGTPKGNRHVGRPRHRCEENIRMDLKEIGKKCEELG